MNQSPSQLLRVLWDDLSIVPGFKIVFESMDKNLKIKMINRWYGVITDFFIKMDREALAHDTPSLFIDWYPWWHDPFRIMPFICWIRDIDYIRIREVSMFRAQARLHARGVI